MYNIRFRIYNKGRKHVTQLIPSVTWKNMCFAYKKMYPKSPLYKETFKDLLGITSNHEIMTSNEKGSKKTTPQCDEVLT